MKINYKFFNYSERHIQKPWKLAIDNLSTIAIGVAEETFGYSQNLNTHGHMKNRDT